MKTSLTTPQLQAPGAGLPLPQRIILKTLIGPVVSKLESPEKSRVFYENLTRKILSLAESIPLEQRSTPVLVSPIIGLEDSSRYWSVNQVLEHLCIVSEGVKGIILSLASGVVPDQVVDISQVKPHHKSNPEQLKIYSAIGPTLLKEVDDTLRNKKLNLYSKATLLHPWFGQFRAQQWYWLLGQHQGIHLKQLRQIAAKLK